MSPLTITRRSRGQTSDARRQGANPQRLAPQRSSLTAERGAHSSPLSALRSPPRSAFTLIEMLVSVALVLLMLLLFANIFGTAVGSMREQQALAQNDQKARALETVMRSDFSHMTFRQPRVKGVQGLVPLAPNWPIDAERQLGFFYYSENDLENPADDVLHLTIDLRRTDRDPAGGILRGRAQGMGGSPNEPDADDGIPGNGLGESPAAEVVYFLRGGNLYRRVMLLRQPPVPTATGAPSEYPMQPTDGSGTRLFRRSGVPGDYDASLDNTLPSVGGPDFWNDFDYSAWNWWRDGIADGNPDQNQNPLSGGSDQYWLTFNGIDSLQNVPGATPFPIANPSHRFGHVPRMDGSPAAPFLAGQPREYLLGPGPGFPNLAFIGRFTQEETSNPFFGYPGVVPEDGTVIGFNPVTGSYPPPAALDADGVIDTNGDNIIDAFAGGGRAGEDLILSGVESFDIEVWDHSIAQFANLGHANVLGSFSHIQNRNRDYGARSVNVGVDGQPGVAAYDDDGDMTTDNPSELGWPGSDDISNRCFDTWHPSAITGTAQPPFQPTQYQKGAGFEWLPGMSITYDMVFFPGVEDRNNNGVLDAGLEDANNNGVLDPGEDLSGNGVLDGREDRNNNGVIDDDTSYYYRPVKVLEDVNGNQIPDGADNPNLSLPNGTLNGITGRRQPEWPREPGATVVERIDTNGDNIPDADGVIWQCFDNRIGLQMIRITVRYKDPGKNLPRQVTIVHSFVE